MTPGYSAAVLGWVEAGGVYAIAGLRGGSEEGEDWHRAGMRERDVGHSVRAVSRSVTLAADTLAFLAAHTGLRLPG